MIVIRRENKEQGGVHDALKGNNTPQHNPEDAILRLAFERTDDMAGAISLVMLMALAVAVSAALPATFFHLSDWHFDPFYNPDFSDSTFCRNETQLDDFENVPLFPPSLASSSIFDKEFSRRIKDEPQPHVQFGQFGCDSPLPLLETASVSSPSPSSSPSHVSVRSL